MWLTWTQSCSIFGMDEIYSPHFIRLKHRSQQIKSLQRISWNGLKLPFFPHQQGSTPGASSPQKWSNFQSLLLSTHPPAASASSKQTQKSSSSQSTVMKNFHGFPRSHITPETRTPKSCKMQQVCMQLGNLSLSVNPGDQWGLCKVYHWVHERKHTVLSESWRPIKSKSEAKTEVGYKRVHTHAYLCLQ